ncbi:MAG TPA: mercury methylation corrinoid protein HgcA [Candidatus Wallbacteria bacterium]|nr:mercury methylation corrinoid protein HgcA [Candidatus Wallbacteria bacterium]
MKKANKFLKGSNSDNHSFIAGFIDTPAGKIPLVTHEIKFEDTIGAVKARLGIGRMKYFIKPGLYAIGLPDKDSPVLVTANYKLTFDSVRKELEGLGAWILVLDTKGVNVWCAAGKGSFGNAELNRLIKAVKLEEIVSHRRIILPQLGAVGIDAGQARRETGFTIKYGPVYSKDIKRYMENGFVKTPDMRDIEFGLADRLKVSLVEWKTAARLVYRILIVIFAVHAISRPKNLLKSVMRDFLPALAAIAGGTFLVPAFLPALPTRSFAIKGFAVGAAGWLFSAMAFSFKTSEAIAHLLISGSLSAYQGLNFTGSATFTSQSATEKEIRKFLPAALASFIACAAALITIRLTEGDGK